MKPVTKKQQLECAQRELEKRRKFYPKWIREKGMNPHVAEAETRAMEAIVSSLEKLMLLGEVSDEILSYSSKDPHEQRKGAIEDQMIAAAERQ